MNRMLFACQQSARFAIYCAFVTVILAASGYLFSILGLVDWRILVPLFGLLLVMNRVLLPKVMGIQGDRETRIKENEQLNNALLWSLILFAGLIGAVSYGTFVRLEQVEQSIPPEVQAAACLALVYVVLFFSFLLSGPVKYAVRALPRPEKREVPQPGHGEPARCRQS